MTAKPRYFEHVAPSGVLKEGTDPVEGIFCGHDVNRYVWPRVAPKNQKPPDPSEMGDYGSLAAEIHFQSWTEEFCRNEHLMKMVRRLRPEWTSPSVLRRQIFRTNMPHAESTTGVHYDQIFLRHGPPTALTAWIPIGDCSPLTGGLIYLENSAELGKEFEDGFGRMCDDKGMPEEDRRSAHNSNMTQKGGLAWDAGEFARSQGRGRRWLIGDYEAGDVVFHLMHTIHASGANRDPEGRIRFSVDLRFIDRDQEYDTRWNEPFFPGDGL